MSSGSLICSGCGKVRTPENTGWNGHGRDGAPRLRSRCGRCYSRDQDRQYRKRRRKSAQRRLWHGVIEAAEEELIASAHLTLAAFWFGLLSQSSGGGPQTLLKKA